MFRKGRLKRLYGVTHYYTDSNKRFEFYYRKNWMGQFDLMVYDIENRSNRWFTMTPAVFYALLGIDKDGNIKTYKKNITKAPKPRVVNELLHNKYYTLISHQVARLNAHTVVARTGEFGPPEAREKVLLLKAVASIPEQEYMVLGMDTIEIPFEGVTKLIELIKEKHFKGVEIEMEEEDAVNKN